MAEVARRTGAGWSVFAIDNGDSDAQSRGLELILGAGLDQKNVVDRAATKPLIDARRTRDLATTRHETECRELVARRVLLQPGCEAEVATGPITRLCRREAAC